MILIPVGAAFGAMAFAGMVVLQPVQVSAQSNRDDTISEDVAPQPSATISPAPPIARDPRTRPIARRLERDAVADRIVPTARLQTRVRSRIQNRLRTRIDPTYVAPDTTSPYAIAEDQARDTGSRRGVRPR